MAAPSKKNKHFDEVVRLHFEEGMTLRAIGASINVHEVTLSKWLKSEGLTPRQSGYTQNQVIRAAKAGETKEARTCRHCGMEFEDYVYRNRAFCSRECTNEWQRENATEGRFQRWCPCGKEIEKNPYQNKHCSPDCRKKYGKKKQADPENYATFNCLNCDTEVTRYKKLGMHKYCSNACAQRHTRKKQHIVVDDAVVLDSSYEALFWSLCAFLKIPVERFDREQCIELPNGHHYGPDFYLPQQELYVETKGFEDEDDRQRYAAWQIGHPIVVLDRAKLDVLRRAPRAQFEEYLGEWSLISW